jgi:hypothetical protein
MAKFLDGVQSIDDVIQEFNTVASGTINVAIGNQYPNTNSIARPTKLYRNYVLIISNKTGQTLNTVTAFGLTPSSNIPMPNTASGTAIYLKNNISVSIGTNNSYSAIDLTSEEPNPFLVGMARFAFNLAASPTAAGTIDYALIGY